MNINITIKSEVGHKPVGVKLLEGFFFFFFNFANFHFDGYKIVAASQDKASKCMQISSSRDRSLLWKSNLF